MKTRKIIILSVSVVLLLATAAGAYALSPKKAAKAEPVWSEGVMRICINTISGSMDAINADLEHIEKASFEISDENGKLLYKSGGNKIHAHGNSSFWLTDKKSYTLKLPEARNLLSHSETDSYVLVSNFADISMLRNKMVYDTARRTSPYWSPACDYAEVYFNGEYGGLYLFVEKIEEETLGIKDGGFLCENIIMTYGEKGFYVAQAVYPIDSGMLSSYMMKMQSVNAAVSAEDGRDPKTGKHYTELIDVESFARKYLIEEIFQNIDINVSSNFSYSTDGGAIINGPCWDYDKTLNSYPDAFLALQAPGENMEKPLYYHLYQMEEFAALVRELYKTEYLPILEEYLSGGLDALDERIATARERDLSVWESAYLNFNLLCAESVPYDVASIKEYLATRIEFLNRVWIDGEDLYRDIDLGYLKILAPSETTGDTGIEIGENKLFFAVMMMIFGVSGGILLFAENRRNIKQKMRNEKII